MQTLLENGQQVHFSVEYSALMKLAASAEGKSDSTRSEIYFTLISIFLSYVNRRKVHEEIG